jgi:hypothetical protein
MMTYLPDTAEMPAWTTEAPAPTGRYPWGTYTDLGPFKPNWGNEFVPVLQRIQHQGRHQPKLRWGQIRKWASNAVREARELLFGAFAPVLDAM